MTMTDPIADMLTRLRNANRAHHDTVSMPYSKLKNALEPLDRSLTVRAVLQVDRQGLATRASSTVVEAM